MKTNKKTPDKGLFTTDRETFKATINKDTGFLTAPVKLARIGVQHYMGFELGLVDRAMEKIGVLRSPEEVFHKDSIQSFINLVVTDDHPSDFVTVDNVKDLQKGQVSEVKRMGEELDGVVTVTDKGQIEKAKDGKIEVSVGYSNDLKPLKGTYEGVEYEFVQTNIRANHLAIVDAGRCGPACKITLDKNKKEKLVKITVNGITFDTDNEQLAQAIQNQQSAHDAEVEGLKKKLEEEEEEKEKMKKDKDKAEAAKDALEKSTLDSDTINKMVSDMANLLTTAKGILKDKMPECTDCPKEIKTAVIDAVLDLGDLSGKSDDYIDASYDIAVEQSKKAKGSLDNLKDDFKIKDKDGKTVTRDSARKGYAQKMGMEV